jgi:1-acyl-sn-glycerol-3-phosphate acyltransferase
LRRFFLLYFILAIGVMGLFWGYLVIVPLWLLGFFFPTFRELGGKLFTVGVQFLLKVQPWLKARYEISLPYKEHSRFITVSNHRSHLDMFLLLSQIPNIRVISKASLFKVPGLGFMMRMMRMIPIRAGNISSYWEAMNTAGHAAGQGERVHIFPEMTRCSQGAEGTGEFHLAPFRVAYQTGVPIVPIVFFNTDQTWPKNSFGLAYGHPVRVKSLEMLSPKNFENAEALRDEVRRRIESSLSGEILSS